MIRKTFKIITNTVMFLLIIFGILLVFSFVPFPGNYRVYTVMSGSMEPTIHTGSLIFVKPQGNYGVGDIVTRTTVDPKVTITHRIVSNNFESGQVAFTTKGDANNAPDSETIGQDKIIGREFFAVPYIGYPIGYARTLPGMILLVIIPATIIIYEELRKIKKEFFAMLARKKNKKEPTIDDATYVDNYSRSSEADKSMMENIQLLQQYEMGNQLKKRRKMDL